MKVVLDWIFSYFVVSLVDPWTSKLRRFFSAVSVGLLTCAAAPFWLADALMFLRTRPWQGVVEWFRLRPTNSETRALNI